VQVKLQPLADVEGFVSLALEHQDFCEDLLEHAYACRSLFLLLWNTKTSVKISYGDLFYCLSMPAGQAAAASRH
jgi:hypothetical protein